DYANLRATLKGRSLGVPLERMLVNLGTVPAEEFTGPLEQLPRFLSQVAVSLASDEEHAVTVEEIDATVEHAEFADLIETARASKSGALKELAGLMVDAANTRTAIRARRRGRSASELAATLFPGGSFGLDTIESAYTLSVAELVDAIAAMPGLGGVDVASLADPSTLDVVLDNLIARFLRSARAMQFGPEPVIAYVMAREAEVIAVRTLLIGRLAGLDREVLRSRLRELYV
ncbi:MAG: V-type ATPase subunit, partial [Actinomycetia bacterium]|nr:V-type ATPase subunit [Actinomycetes bacterium]